MRTEVTDSLIQVSLPFCYQVTTKNSILYHCFSCFEGLCSCVKGYKLSGDGRTCLPSSLASILLLYPDTPPSPLSPHGSPFNVIKSPTTALDFHLALEVQEKSEVFEFLEWKYSQIFLRQPGFLNHPFTPQKVVYVDQNKIKVQSMRPGNVSKRAVEDELAGSIESLAVDWVSDTVYWTEPKFSRECWTIMTFYPVINF